MKYTLLFCLGLALALFSCEKDNFGVKRSSSEDLSITADGSFAGESGTSNGQAGDTTIQAGQLTAGEWNDLDNWDFWNGLMAKDTLSDYPSHWRFNSLDRISLKLSRQNGEPVIDARATLLGTEGEPLWTARTDNFGRAEFFPNLIGAGGQPATIKVVDQGQSYYLNEVHFFEAGVNEMVIPASGPSSQEADVFFVFDATGSMSDELEYIKVEINDIISRIRSNNGDVDFRLGSVFYRDEGDEYVTRTSNLSSDFAQTVGFINSQRADGGGDYPEAVHSALKKAIEEQQWRDKARTRLLFLILDAPPHYQEDVLEAVQAQLRLAAEKGVKVIPVTASGIDRETEFLMRILAIASNGTYTFITNHSGIGNDHLEPTVGEYEVEFLNDLIVRLVNKYVE
ncbi:MAG: VWA domain-containing protein [Phaeodactylibacter sp.]|nr:VWA domain-containing protein [Phaeodactylibacter sp.]MCB9264099.1 VWA domain-containing protein [Lewinellaceae bacterium]MCB9286719.1 VWA domain-containing protein [Lewinellaceae bacterium]